jgi:hypothetical protein
LNESVPKALDMSFSRHGSPGENPDFSARPTLPT